jgi:hypothetical protein
MKTLPKFVINGFFIVGIFSATLFRALVVINRLAPEIGRVVWYFAVFGYILFFGYRYMIARKRRKTIRESRLIESVEQSGIDEQKKNEILYIMNSLVKSKEMFNYVYIFVVSFIAILIDVLLNIFT